MSVEVKLELGHRAVQREKKTVEGFTHDWTVFVRGAEGNNIQYFVEKVVFHLHESFPKPKRVLKEPPYSVSESGYAGFIMPIDVYFRTREEPRKVTFNYDMYLRLEGLPVSNIRIEKLTFQNPSSEFRSKLIKAGGLAGALSGSAAGGSASLSTQACAPPQHVDDHHQPNPPKLAVAEKKPRSHVSSKELPSKPTPPPPPPKPSQPFTDIFGAPIRTKSSPDSSTVKPKDSGHSSQAKSKTPTSSSSSSSKEGKPSAKDKDSHKSKESHHSKDKDSNPLKESKEPQSSKDAHPPKEPIHPLKEVQPKEPHPTPTKDSSQSLKEGHHPPKEKHPPKEHHSREGHKSKDSHHSLKESKTLKESRPPEPKDSKPSKSIKTDKELSKSSTKRATPTDSHSSHGNVEKKKKSSPISSESSDKSSSQPKHKVKEIKNKAEKHKNKSHSNLAKKEEEKHKHKSSPAPQHPPELKEALKPKPSSPFKAPSPAVKPPTPPTPKPPSPLPITKPPSPITKPPSPITKPPSPDSTSMDSDSDASLKSYYNKAQYSSPASSISESSLHGSNPISGLMSDHSILSPLSDEDDSSPSVPKRKLSSGDFDLGGGSPDFKSLENKPMPKLKKKQNSSHHKSFKPKPSENYHRGNGSINNDIPLHHSPILDFQNNYINNMAYRQELLQMQQIIMSTENRQLLQNIVDLIEKTGKYEVTNTTFDFDLCSLDPAIIQKIKLCLQNCDKYV